MKLGKQAGKLIPCAVKPLTHGFHPAGETCNWCPPQPYAQMKAGYFSDKCTWCGCEVSDDDLICATCGALL